MVKKLLIIFALLVLALLFLLNAPWAKKQQPFSNPHLPEVSKRYVQQYLLKPLTPVALKGIIESPYDHIIGYTYYDFQHNSAIPRMIANDYQEAPCGENGIHSTYMKLTQPEITSNRYICYAYKAPCNPWGDDTCFTPSFRRAGYGGLDIFLDSRVVLIYHHVNPGPDPSSRRSVITIQKPSPGAKN
ncbi:MAG: hypothetical protein AMJ90_09955, partial [candidate division Zixibacteria bacterium SM23_73_2]